jgi:hypothetical protein
LLEATSIGAEGKADPKKKPTRSPHPGRSDRREEGERGPQNGGSKEEGRERSEGVDTREISEHYDKKRNYLMQLCIRVQ